MEWTQLGTINQPGYWDVPPLPDIVSEWAGIVPLICHLASRRQSHQCVGQLALLQRLSVDLFPRLGVLSGLAKLLKTGPAFLDDASTKGSSSTRVWDVIWGGSFPCANGAASAALLEYALKKQTSPPQTMPDRRPAVSNSASSGRGTHEKLPAATSAVITPFRRYQTLHVLTFQHGPKRTSWLRKLDLFLSSFAGEVTTFLCSLALGMTLTLFGVYGSAALILSSAVARFACYFYTVRRPPGYLGSNEAKSNCCMLVGTHENVHNWYLFTGDRGIVDALLNKTMVDLAPDRYGRLLAAVFEVAHLVQLLGMTFVAAQKGWDGVVLIVLLLASRVFRWRYSSDRLARLWLEREGVTVSARSYHFTGRTMMLGAVLKLSGSRITSWMDSIVTPHARREAWLSYLLEGHVPRSDQWSEHDLTSIQLSAELADAAAEVIKADHLHQGTC